MENLDRILLTAIAIERYGQQFYGSFSDAIADEKGKALMRGLAGDEKEHESLLISEYEEMIGSPIPEHIDIDIGNEGVDEIFSAARNVSGSAEATIEILQMGVDIEQKSIEFYSSRADETDDPDLKKLLAALVKIEKEHKALLEENLFHLRQDGAWWGYVPILEG